MKKLARFVARRQALADRYDRQVADLAPLVQPIARSAAAEPAWHIYPLLIDFDAAGRSRAAVMEHLKAAGLGSPVHYLPVHLQPYYRQSYGAPSPAQRSRTNQRVRSSRSRW